MSTPEGYPSLSRIAAIVEQVKPIVSYKPFVAIIAIAVGCRGRARSLSSAQVAFLKQEGKEVLVVTSGAVGVGRQASKVNHQQRFCLILLLAAPPSSSLVAAELVGDDFCPL